MLATTSISSPQGFPAQLGRILLDVCWRLLAPGLPPPPNPDSWEVENAFLPACPYHASHPKGVGNLSGEKSQIPNPPVRGRPNSQTHCYGSALVNRCIRKERRGDEGCQELDLKRSEEVEGADLAMQGTGAPNPPILWDQKQHHFCHHHSVIIQNKFNAIVL